MTIIEKINSLENGRLMGVINSVDEGEERTSTWAGSTGITTDEVKSLTTALQAAVEALERSLRVIEDLLGQQAMPDNSYDADVFKITQALTKIHALIGETKGGEK